MADNPTYFAFTSREFLPEEKKIIFGFECGFEDRDPLTFVETIHVPERVDSAKISSKLVDNLLKNLHIVLGVSYYKLYCPSEIRLSEGLSDLEADFWDI